MGRQALDAPTKTCNACGITYARKRRPDGTLEPSTAWRRRRACSVKCARANTTANRPENESRKTCEACGRTYERAHRKSGLEPRTTWLARRACSVQCHGVLRRRATLAKHAAEQNACIACGKTTGPDYRGRARKTCSSACRISLMDHARAHQRLNKFSDFTHAPCAKCGAAVLHREGEKPSQWLRRRTCSAKCAGHVSSVIPKARAERQKLAPAGHTFDGRFPTPATLKSAWVPITGPDTGVAVDFERNGVTRSPRTLAMLRAALLGHPDLAEAFAGALNDSWAPIHHGNPANNQHAK